MASATDVLDQMRFETERLSQAFEAASRLGSGTPQEVADHREGAFGDLIQRYYPHPYRVTKGQIVAADGGKSASIDCVILSADHPYTVDARGKYTLLLADGVERAIDVKGRLDGSELDSLIRQGLSVKALSRSRTAIVSPSTRRQPELVETSLRIPFFGYCHSAQLAIATIATRLAEAYERHEVEPARRLDAVVIHDQGAIVDTSALGSPGAQLLPTAPPGLYWVGAEGNTVGLLLGLLVRGFPGRVAVQAPVISAYALFEPGTAEMLRPYA